MINHVFLFYIVLSITVSKRMRIQFLEDHLNQVRDLPNEYDNFLLVVHEVLQFSSFLDSSLSAREDFFIISGVLFCDDNLSILFSVAIELVEFYDSLRSKNTFD